MDKLRKQLLDLTCTHEWIESITGRMRCLRCNKTIWLSADARSEFEEYMNQKRGKE